MDTALFWLLITMGITGGLHCAAMCGPLALVATGGVERRAAALALYLTGKASSYVLLGAFAGALGETIVRFAPLGIGRRFVAVAGGALLLFVALRSLGVVRDSPAGLGWLAKMSKALAALAAEGGLTGRLLLGCANGFLPCPMTYGFLAIAAVTGSPISGAAAMLVLAITSAVPLAIVAFAGSRIARLRVFRLPALNGAVMLVIAGLTIYRGLAATPACCP